MSARDGRRLGFPLARKGTGEASERAAGQGKKSLVGWGNLGGQKYTLLHRRFSAAVRRRNRRDESASFPQLGWKDTGRGGRERSNGLLHPLLPRKRCNTKIDFPQRRSGKEGESEKEEDERSSQSVCRARLREGDRT